MDVEKTIAFILEMQARTEVQMQRSQERMEQFQQMQKTREQSEARMQKDREQSEARMQKDREQSDERMQKDREQFEARMQKDREQLQAQMAKDREKAQESHNFFLKQHEIVLKRHKFAMERMDKFDIQLKATANLVRAGMKMVIEDRREFKAGMADLRAAQKRTEATLASFIASLKGRNGNGHKN